MIGNLFKRLTMTRMTNVHHAPSLPPVMEQHTTDKVRAQQDFLRRGRASLARAQAIGVFYNAADELAAMRQRLMTRMAALRQ